MKPKPFNWTDYIQELKKDPAFNLLEKFSFDHLSDQERAAIGHTMRQMGSDLKAEAAELEEFARRSRLELIEGGKA